MRNWSIEEHKSNLVFKYRSEIKSCITTEGKFHTFDDVLINSGNTIEKLPGASKILRDRFLNLDYDK
jgi:hypothetical protein